MKYWYTWEAVEKVNLNDHDFQSTQQKRRKSKVFGHFRSHSLKKVNDESINRLRSRKCAVQ